jgi:hypothetical protein
VEGFADGVDGSSDWALARPRIGPEGVKMRLLEAWIKGGAFKHLNRPAVAAILRVAVGI